MLKQGLSEQLEQQQRQPQPPHQLYHPHPNPHHHHNQQQQHQQQQGTRADTTGGTILQSANATVSHQLTVNAMDYSITEFSLCDSALIDYSCINK